MNAIDWEKVVCYATPVVTGASLAAIGLAKKYPTVVKYVYSYWVAWVYLIFSALGGLLVTLTMGAVGARVIQNELLNHVFQGLLGAGLFLGIISRVSISQSENEVGAQLKTIRDAIYEFLDDALARRVMQNVESRIKAFGKEIDSARLLSESTRLVGGITKLNAEQQLEQKVRFDDYASRGDYVSIVRVLIAYYEVDYVVGELAGCILGEAEDSRVSSPP